MRRIRVSVCKSVELCEELILKRRSGADSVIEAEYEVLAVRNFILSSEILT